MPNPLAAAPATPQIAGTVITVCAGKCSALPLLRWPVYVGKRLFQCFSPLVVSCCDTADFTLLHSLLLAMQSRSTWCCSGAAASSRLPRRQRLPQRLLTAHPPANRCSNHESPPNRKRPSLTSVAYKPSNPSTCA